MLGTICHSCGVLSRDHLKVRYNMPLMWSVRRGHMKVRYNMPLMWSLSRGHLKVTM